ncbi:MAG: hypothetical protein KIT09_22200 [Bryobacteraceae bacterium]|nr:hypothetical protein [Bryobacteraceae bacterium]
MRIWSIAVTLVVVVVWAAPARAQLKTKLREDTLAAFTRYIAAAEKTMRQRWDLQRSFLWAHERKEVIERLRKGEIVIEKAAVNPKIDIPNGIAHHWIAAVLIPNGKMENALALLQDFDRHQQIYPEIVSSRVLEQKGDSLRGYWRLRKEKILTVVLDVEQTAEYFQAGGGRWYNVAAFKQVREVEDAGEPDERALPPDEGHGFLWRLNGYWRLEPAPEGLYMECETITLSRDIPFGLSFVIGPMTNGLPRESLLGSMRATRDALR